MAAAFFCSTNSQFRRAAVKTMNPAQTSSSSKNAGPALRAKKMHPHFLISQSDRQCFSHEDRCFAPGNKVLGQPALAVPKVLIESAIQVSLLLLDSCIRTFRTLCSVFLYPARAYSCLNDRLRVASTPRSAGLMPQKKAADKSARQPFLNMRCPPPLFQYLLPVEIPHRGVTQ